MRSRLMRINLWLAEWSGIARFVGSTTMAVALVVLVWVWAGR